MASAFWAYPLAGAVIGAAGGLVFWGSMMAGFSPHAAAIVAIAAMLLISGGLHEDGFSDFWDGLGGGATRAAKLAIMRDSRLGTYGALALMLMLGLQVVLLADIHVTDGNYGVIAALLASEATARGAIALPILWLAPARSDGLGAAMKNAGRETLSAGVVLSAGIVILSVGPAGLVLLLGASAGAVVIAFLASRFLGGFTGDVLGATAVMARLAALGVWTLIL